MDNTPGTDVTTRPAGSRLRRFTPLVLWLLFGTGVLIQAFTPRLKIQDNAFVIPPAMVTGDNTLNPDKIVARERRIQFLSAAATLAGALGLAYYYRKIFVRTRPS